MENNKFSDFASDGLTKSVKPQFDYKKALFVSTFLLIYVPILILDASPLAKDKDFNIFLGGLIIGLPIVFYLLGRLLIWKR